REMYESGPEKKGQRAVYLEVLERCGRTAEAAALSEKFLQADPTRFELRADFVMRLARAGKTVRAMQEVLAWLEDEPEDARLSSLLIDVLRETGEYEQMLMYIRAVGGGEGVDPFDLLMAYVRTKRYDEAMDLARALMRVPRGDVGFDATLFSVAQQ